MSNRPRPSGPASRPPTRRQIAAQQREANVQRRTVLAIGGALALAALLIIAGVVYERIIQPNTTLRQVNGVSLTRGEYERLQRTSAIQQLAQTLQLSKLFGANQSFGQTGRFDEQVVQTNLELATLGTARNRDQPIDETVISQWVDQQIIEQNAKSEFQIDPSAGEIDQAVIAQYGSVIQTTPEVTATETLTDTAELTATTEAATAEAATTTASPPTPTTPPTATPEAAQATEQTNQVVDELYTEYSNILTALPQEALESQRTPHVTKDELAQALRASFREQVIRERVSAALVKEVPADDQTEPTTITVRHILLQVPEPEPTPEPTTAAPDATATEEAATATAEPTPTPKPSVEELEQQFTERKAEADAIYQRVAANPDSFADVARAESDDPGSKEQGGELPAFDRAGNITGGQEGQTLVKEFADAAWALKENEISQPVRTQFGWHIIQRLPEDPQAKLTRLQQSAFDAWLAEKRQTATIVPPPTPTPTEIPPVTTEEPTTETAQPEATTTP
jgi:hypothetical protein